MKRKVFLAVALIALMAAAVFAQTFTDDDWQFKEGSAVGSNGATYDGYIITGYTGSATTVRIPFTLEIENPYKVAAVVGIGEGALKNNTKITTVNFRGGNNVCVIGKSAFEGCTNLTKVTIPNFVTVIEAGTFKGCAKLANVTFEKDEGKDFLTTIGGTHDNGAFSKCTSLASITLPETLTTIGKSAFWGTGLTSVNIPNKVTRIEDHAFVNSPNLASVTIPASVTFIGGRAFYGCTSLTSVTFGGSLSLSGFDAAAFETVGDIRSKFYAANASTGTPGRYMRPDGKSQVWTKQ